MPNTEKQIFNIHSFKLKEFITDDIVALSKTNPFIEALIKLSDDENGIIKNYYRNYYTISNNKSIEFVKSDNFKNIIKNTNSECILKNRILSDSKIKSRYFTKKDHLNFLECDLENGVKNKTDVIFYGLSFKDIENIDKFFINSIVSTLLGHTSTELYHILRNNYINIQVLLDLQHFSNRTAHLMNCWLRDFGTVLSNIKQDILLKYNVCFGDILENNKMLFKKINELENCFNSAPSNTIYSYSGFEIFETLKKIKNYLQVDKTNISHIGKILLNLNYYNANRIINNTFDYTDYITQFLKENSVVQKTEVLNPYTGGTMIQNVRLSIKPENDKIVEKYTNEIKLLTNFQELLSHSVKNETNKYNEENCYDFETVTGKEIPYYYNIATYYNSKFNDSLLLSGRFHTPLYDNMNRFSMINENIFGSELYNSCMRYPHCYNNIKWYSNNKKISLLILTNKNKTNIKGRAILFRFDDRTYVGRFFGIDDKSKLLFANYINDSNFIPIYEYKGMSTDKLVEYNERKFNNEELDIRDVSLFTKTPYIDGLRNGFLKYDENVHKYNINIKDDEVPLVFYDRSNLNNVRRILSEEEKYHNTIQLDEISIIGSEKYHKCKYCGKITKNKYTINNEDIAICNDHTTNIGEKDIVIDNDGIIVNYNKNNKKDIQLLRLYTYDLIDNEIIVSLKLYSTKNIIDSINNGCLLTKNIQIPNAKTMVADNSIIARNHVISNNLQEEQILFNNVIVSKNLIDYLKENDIISYKNILTSCASFIIYHIGRVGLNINNILTEYDKRFYYIYCKNTNNKPVKEKPYIFLGSYIQKDFRHVKTLNDMLKLCNVIKKSLENAEYLKDGYFGLYNYHIYTSYILHEYGSVPTTCKISLKNDSHIFKFFNADITKQIHNYNNLIKDLDNRFIVKQYFANLELEQKNKLDESSTINRSGELVTADIDD